MKKFLLAFMFVFIIGFLHPISANSQTHYYRTTEFSYKQLTNNGKWTSWSDWEESDMLVSMNLSNDVVVIFSPQTQRYKITQHVRNYTDTSGGKQAEYKFIDQDGDKGSMRLRVEKNGNYQLYIEFSDIMWVYNIKQISNIDGYQ